MARSKGPSSNPCVCGCGNTVSIGRRFVSGHHLRVMKKTPEHIARVAESRRRYFATRPPSDPLPRILAQRVITPSGCWQPPTNYDNGTGYRYIKAAGRRVYLHRFVYERLVAPIPEGLQIDHVCRNRACFNPDHLEPVTAAENVRRSVAARKEQRNA